MDGILFRLIDTAGIREHSTDVIELIGIEKTSVVLHRSGHEAPAETARSGETAVLSQIFSIIKPSF